MSARTAHNKTAHSGAALTAQPTMSGATTLMLCFSVAIAGASVMVIELMGTRILAPVFGADLYVWTSQISIALLCLTIGYPAGGWLADRYPRFEVFYLVNAACGIGVLITMLIRGPTLHLLMDAGPRLGALLSSFCLFACPLVLMGMVGPFAARLFVRDMSRVGVTIGKLSALSAGGSILGSIVTGFVLIPNVTTNTAMFSVAGTMLLIGVAGLLTTRAARSAIAAATTVALSVLLALLIRQFAHDPSIAAELRENGVDVLYEGSSAYGDIKVVDSFYSFPAPSRERIRSARFMFIGQMIQTIAQLNEARLGHITTLHDMTFAMLAARPDMERVLLIGLAGGTKVLFFNERGIHVDAVEIDPLVVEKADEYFGVRENELTNIFVEDGRAYFNHCKRQYDVIIMDVFGGGTAPAHLFSLEAVEQIKRCLVPDGLMVMNCVYDATDPDDLLLPCVQTTLAEEFRNLRVVVWEPHIKQEPPLKNYFTFASDGPVDYQRPLSDFMPTDDAAKLEYAQAVVEIPTGHASVITDAHNPLDLLQIQHSEKVRRVTLSRQFRPLFDPRR